MPHAPEVVAVMHEFFGASDEADKVNMATEIARLRALLPAPHERFVRVAPEMVEQLTAAESEPVTIAVEARAHGELFLVLTRWNTPPNPPDADIRNGIEYFMVDGREEQQCARCGSSVVMIDCNHCGGEGTVEVDAGDGIVPDLRDVECEPCDGEGAWPICCSGKAWCDAHPMPGREHVKTTAREEGYG
jgi:ribosomal protein S27AE